ncbi:hypothetical protein CRYUN_Cryun16bG0077100 [Craigia yunnanensis]
MIAPEQHRENLASEFVKSLGNLSEPALSTTQAQLLNEFLQDDVCPLGAQFPMDAPHQVYQAGAEENKSIKEVLETTHQFGRSSISTGPDMSYKEIAYHSEALLTGKQQKMSHLMSAQLSLISLSFQHPDNKTKQAGPVLEQTGSTNPFKQPVGTLPMQCATEYQNHPQSFSLPSSSPYDNFLKAAGC